jgi:hypothetical protein
MSFSSSPTASAPASPAPPSPQPASTKKPRFSSLEKELIAKLRSKKETKLGILGSSSSSRKKVDNRVLPQFYPAPYLLVGQQHLTLPGHQQMEFLFDPHVTDAQNNSHHSLIAATTEATAQHYKNPSPLPPPLQTAKRCKKTSFPELPGQSSEFNENSLEPINEQTQSRKQQTSHQRKAVCPLGQPDPQIPPQLPPMSKQQFAPPTREQTSLAEQKRREAQKETPITFNEREMSQKEIQYSKSLLMCFLSGRGNNSPDGAMKIKRGRSDYDDATSDHLDRYQHDPSNHEMAYHYSVPTSTSQKKKKST